MKRFSMQRRYEHFGTAWLIALACLFVVVPASVARAQGQSAGDGGENAIEEIVVTGSYSQGLERALGVKRQSDSIADAVVAADIGKLPAVNVAEALQRLPGVTINREAGEGQFVSVRGLGPNFQSVTFNGVPIAFNENIRNSDQSGRQFRFRVVPADLIGGVVVTKAPTADLIDGGIGSNVNLVTVSPLSRESFVSGHLASRSDVQADAANPNGSVSAGWRNSDSTLGLIGGVSYNARDVRFDRLQTFGYRDYETGGESAKLAGGYGTTMEQEQRQRISALGGVEWTISDRLDGGLDVMFSQFNNDIAENRVMYEFSDYGSAVAALDPSTLMIENGVVTRADVVNGGRINRNAEFSEQTHANTFINLDLNYSGDVWAVQANLSRSDATSGLDKPLQRIDSRTTDSSALQYGFDFGGDPVRNARLARLNGNLELTDPGAVPFRRYRIRPINAKDEDTTVLLSAEREFSAAFGPVDLTSFRFGGQYTDRSRDYQRRDRTLAPSAGVVVDSSFFGNRLPSDGFSSVIGDRHMGWTGPSLFTFSENFEGRNGEFTNTFVQASQLTPTGSDLQRSYGVNEDIQAIYARMDFDFEYSGVPVDGNVGVRWVDTNTGVIGTVVSAGDDGSGGTTRVVTPFLFEGQYDELLPSLNLSAGLSDDVLLRLAVSKSLTRPSLADLRSSVVPNSFMTSEIFELGAAAIGPGTRFQTIGDRTGVGGNPTLSPYVATNFDASIEWYFNDFGAFSFAGFYKDVSDFISSGEGVETLAFPVSDGSTLPVDVLIARPQNVGDGNIAGVEFGYSGRMESGLGLSASVTFVKASVDNNGIEQELQGVSEKSYSITPFFERGPFELHVSWTWRSEHYTNSNISIGTSAAVAGDQISADAFGTLDFGGSYQLTDRFEVFAEGINVTNERQVAIVGSQRLFLQAHSYGPSYNLGVKAIF
jgi:TonB-dependent receptor